MKTTLIGLGPHGLRLYKCLRELDEFEICGLVDKRDSVKEKIESEDHTLFYTDLDEMYSQESPEVVVICTNGPSHKVLAERAMQEGAKRLFISKPLACSIADSLAIQQMANETNTRVVVDHGLRHDKSYIWLREQVINKTYGELVSAYIQRPGIGLGCLGVHSFDLANYLFGKNPERVTGWIDEPVKKNPRGEEFVDPGGTVILEYGGGNRALIEQIETGSGPMSVELNFNFARVRMDEKFRTMEVVSKDPEFVPGPGRPAPLDRQINPHGEEVKHDIFYLMKQLLLELAGDGEMEADIGFGVTSVEILAAAYQSHEEGNKAISLPLTSEEFINRFLPVT